MGEQPRFPAPQPLAGLLPHLLRAPPRAGAAAGAAHLPATEPSLAVGTAGTRGDVRNPGNCTDVVPFLPWAESYSSGSGVGCGSCWQQHPAVVVSWLPAPSCCPLPPGTGVQWQMGLGHAVPCARGCWPASWGCRGPGDVEAQGKARHRLSFCFKTQRGARWCSQEGRGGCLPEITFLGGFGCSGTGDLRER